MSGYLLRRALLVVPTLVGMSVLTFGLSNLTPGDPAFVFASRVAGRPPTSEEVAAARHDLGLEGNFVSRYLDWAQRAARGDLGDSFSTRRPVRDELVHRIPYTLQLAVPAALLAVVIAVPAGTISALRRNRPVDQALRVASLAGASIPSFWLALLLIVVFAVKLSVVPVAGRGGLASFVLPTVTLAMAPAAVLARFTRSTLLEALASNYITTAQGKGLAQWLVVVRHALRNALVPLLTAFGNHLGHLVAGTTVIETVFVWPGVGRLLVDAILQRDYPVVSGVILYAGVAFVVVNLVVDVCYSAIDPRIAVSGEAGGAST